MTCYPSEKLLQPQDAAKLVYQRAFGCKHMLNNPNAARSYLKKEYASCLPMSEPLYESIGCGMTRINLRSAVHVGIPCDWIWEAMCLTASDADNDTNTFQQELSILTQATNQGRLPFAADEWLVFLQDWKNNNYPPVSHSEAYHKAFQPAYRVIRQDFCTLIPLIDKIQTIVRSNKLPLLIAIDGPCGSGKSTLAQTLCSLLKATLIHVDNFYLQPDLRSTDWKNLIAGNIYHTLLHKVLAALMNNTDISVENWQCQSNQVEKLSFKANNMIILEGSYSHLIAQAFATNLITVFINIDADEQQRRLTHRNPNHMTAFRQLWIPMEKRYFAAHRVCESSDIQLQNPPSDFPILP